MELYEHQGGGFDDVGGDGHDQGHNYDPGGGYDDVDSDGSEGILKIHESDVPIQANSRVGRSATLSSMTRSGELVPNHSC